MGGWAGYEHDLLKAANLPDTNATVIFVIDWNFHASSDCTNNPLDISHPHAGATPCKKLTATRTALSYPSPSAAESAFAAEILSGQFSSLVAAIRSGAPYDFQHPTAVVDDLKRWGSPQFAAYYAQTAGIPASPPPKLKAPQALGGWADLRRAVNRKLPDALHTSAKLRANALRELGRASKVLK